MIVVTLLLKVIVIIKMKQMKGGPPSQAIASCFHGVRLLHCSFQTPANQCGSVPKSGPKLTAQIFPLRAEHLLTFPDLRELTVELRY